jgi:hypothetical protein
MLLRCKFVMAGDKTEAEIYETLKQELIDNLSQQIYGLEYIEVEHKEFTNYMAPSRVAVNCKIRLFDDTEVSPLFDIYTWTSVKSRHYYFEEGVAIGLDEITIGGERIDVLDGYQVPHVQSTQLI